MSRINFESLRSHDPQHKQLWDQLESWFAKNEGIDELDAKDIARDLGYRVNVHDLVHALTLISLNSRSKLVYRLIGPQQTEVGEFDSLAEIPDRELDRMGIWFDTKEAEIRPVILLHE